MQKAAQIVCRQYGGQLPADYAALRALPGIGDYTAGAIASIAFDIPAPAVDGNVLRVFARLDNNSADITKPAAKREFTARVLEEMPKERPGPYNEALMELGALVCLPNGAPKCEVCPLAAQCKGRAAGRAEQLPVKTAKPGKTLVPVTAALITGPQGVLLQRRPSKGLLAGLWQPLAFEGTAMTQPELDAALRTIGLCVQWQAPLQSTRHVFTHRIWQISGFCGTAAGPAGGQAHLQPHRMAAVRCGPHGAGAGGPGGLRLGQPRGAERGIRGAKRICGHYAPVAAGIKSKQSGMAFDR